MKKLLLIAGLFISVAAYSQIPIAGYSLIAPFNEQPLDGSVRFDYNTSATDWLLYETVIGDSTFISNQPFQALGIEVNIPTNADGSLKYEVFIFVQNSPNLSVNRNIKLKKH